MTEFAHIYETYFRDVELYLRAICRDEALAEELSEQVFFQALKALPTFRGDCDIRTWLCAMARNAFLSHQRKEKSTESIDEIQIPDPRKTVEERITDQEQAMASPLQSGTGTCSSATMLQTAFRAPESPWRWYECWCSPQR